MATTKKRSSKKAAAKKLTPAQKRVATAQANKRKQNLRGAAKKAAGDAALKRARNPKGVRATLAARERGREKRLGMDGTAISPSALKAMDAEAKAKGFRSASEAVRAPTRKNPAGAKLKRGKISAGGKMTNVYKVGSQG